MMQNKTILTVSELKKDIEGALEYDFMTNKPYIFDRTFDTKEEAVEYELQHDELYKDVKNLSLESKIIQYWDQNDTIHIEPCRDCQ